MDGRRHFERDAAGARMQNGVAAQRDIFPSLFAPFVRDEVRELIVAVGSSGMRFRSEDAVPFARFFGRRNRLKPRFELMFRGSVQRSKTENRSCGRSVLFELSGNRRGQNQQRNKGDCKHTQGKPHVNFVLQKNKAAAANKLAPLMNQLEKTFNTADCNARPISAHSSDQPVNPTTTKTRS